ncbi:hypothetical protein HAZT_HAZT003596 [Hyalella azteca]|uniref:Rho-GAP domain-containing protein n=1 Tax=Hyalella azteca TaxID=294128 RepID=A0A6A0H0J2_HYAAZ|nr:hypothetical protein HAZT_HAZT003596 [Hyalella azteca]
MLRVKCKTVTVTSNTNARECINLILDHLEMRDADVTKFQLWVKSSLEDSPYPLIGHEFPFAIKYNCMRETMQDCDAEQCNNLYNNGSHSSGADVKCQFILRQERKPGLDGLNADSKKVSKKARKSPIRIHNVFKRSNSKGDSIDGAGPAPPGILFGHSLGKLFAANGSALPKPIMDMLMQLFQKGPFTVGIFRKSANARLVRELREKLDSGCPSDLSSTNITAVAAILKEFLRSLPDSLLCSQFYDEWLEIPSLSSVRDQISHTLLLCSRLPRANLLLLQHFLCILHHIARRSSQNMMPPSNLAVCVGPSLLWPSSPIVAFNPETSKQAPSVIEFLIERFGEVFGEAMLRIMGDPPEQDSARQDSGAEESDSLHSGHSLHSCNGRRDDSSIDSLERDLEGELSPLPRKDKMSLTNLSRDSGLTMSDTQLYTPDEEESESTSSGHSSGDKNAPYPDHRNVERVQHYPAPNNPNAIYTAVCRRSDKSNGYDEHENYYATPSREHTRVHITYSTPNYAVGNKDYSLQTYSPERLSDNSRMTYENDSIYSVPSTDPSHKQVLEIENVNSNFQRDDPMRRKSNLRKAYKTNNVEHGLIRTTSEESLLSKYNNHEYGMSLGASGTTNLRSPSAERTRSPATIEYDDSANFITRDSPLRRSRSAHYLAEVRKEKLKDNSENLMSISRSASQDTVSWLRSRSTSNIQDEVDRSYDSSTLSDDDSTPHVSRSNSRGKECGSGSNGHWDPQTPSDSGNSRNSSFKSERTGSVCTVISAGSCSTLSSNPPSYEEALNRRSIMLQHQQQQNSGSPSQFNDHSIREEKVKSARAKKLYADSLRLYQEEKVFGDIVRASPAHTLDVDEVDCPPPLPPKGDPPPLPPKQRSSRRMSSENSNKLKHLPPVHVETTSRKKQSSLSLNSSVGPTMHKTIIYTDVGPPNLPPKERTVIEVVESTNDRDRTVRTVAQPVVEKKSIETQTDDCDLDDDDDIRDDDSPTSDAWMSDHVTSVQVPDSTYNNYNINSVSASSNGNSKSSTKRSRGRPRRRDSSASQRSRSVPSRDSAIHPSSSDSEDDEWEFPHEYPGAVNYGLRDFANYEPELRQEISWSVSQLRAIFGESLKGAKVHPPPYRPPPIAGRAPITSYHLGAKDNFCRKSSRPQSSYGEESYV